MKRSHYILICCLGLTAIILSIFFFSGQKGSDSHAISKSIASAIASFWYKNINYEYRPTYYRFLVSALDVPVRKLAHLCIYMTLGLITMSSFRFFLKNKVTFLHVALCILLVIFVAICDEINQYFSGGRGSSVRDVIIDAIGGLIGCYLSYMITDFIRHIKNATKKL